MDDALNRLADAAGIEARYWDIQGRLHETLPQTTRRLLGALGLPAETREDVSASLTQLEERSWRETLPPVIVAIEGCEIAVPLRLSAAADQNLRWSLNLEDGRLVEGGCSLADLTIESIGVLDGISIVLRRLRLPAQPTGYHRLRVEKDTPFTSSLIVAPSRCYLPPLGARYWGVATQLYAVRSENNWGIGDFTDLRALMDWAGEHGAAAVGVNPLHALFLDTPENASPYSPCSRYFLNPLYLDVTAVPNGTHNVELRLFDAGGNQATVGPVGVVVQNPLSEGAAPLTPGRVSLRKTALAGSYGSKLRLEGVIMGLDETPLAGAAVEVASRPMAAGSAFSSLKPVATDAQGRFSIPVESGPSRVYRVRYGVSEATAEVRIRAPLKLRVTPSKTKNGRSVRFRGSIAGATAAGVRVELQARAGKKWVPFRTAALKRTRFSASYRFTSTTARTRYTFRAVVRADPDLPYAPATSNLVSVVVRP